MSDPTKQGYQPTEGDKDHPVQRVFDAGKEVHWDAYVAILQIDHIASDFFDLRVIDPSDGIIDFNFSGSKLEPDYYKDKYGVFIPGAPVIGNFVVDVPIENVWFVHGDTFGAGPFPNPFFDAAIESQTAFFGRPPDIFVTGVDGVHFTFHTVTREDGSIVHFIRGYTTLDGEFEEAVWYDVGELPAVDLHIIRNLWMINLLKDESKTLEITATGSTVSHITPITLTLYPKDTTFTFDGSGGFTTDKIAIPHKTFTTTAPSTQSGTIVRFDKTGFLKGNV